MRKSKMEAIICFPQIDWHVQFPMGVYKIKNYCKEQYTIHIIDERLEDADAIIDDLLKQNNILCLGVSVMTGQQISSAIRISEKYHERIPIVWGGVHPTICPESVITKKYVDYIIRGDGEAAFLELLVKLEKKNADTHLNDNIFCFEQLDNSMIDFETENIRDEYFVRRDGFSKAFPLETSRGCPHRCAFCHNAIHNFKYRTISTGKVLESINQLKNIYDIDGIIFQEDNFFLQKERAISILKELKTKKIGWKANSRISYFANFIDDKDFMRLLLNSGCHVLQFGIESGNNRILEMINKRIKVEDVVSINKKLAEYEISIRYNFIIGFPTETLQEINDTLNLINRLLEDNPYMENPFVNIYTPYPETPLYTMALDEGFSEPKELEEWAKIVWNTPNLSLHSEEMCKYLHEISNQYLEKSSYLH